ncbi:MAG: gamma carbonic anhydrase family protein [SAR324 cluster bacterium]|nr:gamma carbonic anhydrase family protein [SAR324 cluster bacterium]
MEKIGPEVHYEKASFIHSSVHLYGKILLEDGVSIWPQAVMRAESDEIMIGRHSNIQDFVMIHVGEKTGVHIGAYCSITHHCVIHGATIEDNCLIGIGARVTDACVVGRNSIVAGGSFLKEGTIIPENSIVVGTPGKVIRTQNNWVSNRYNAWIYQKNALAYAQGSDRIWADANYQKEAEAEMQRLKNEFLKSQEAESRGAGED